MITSKFSNESNPITPISPANKETEGIMKTLTNTEEIKDFYEYSEECMKRILKLKLTPLEEIGHLLINLPQELANEINQNRKKLAIFDLDETLVHCEIKNPKKGQVRIKVTLPSGTTTKVNNLFYQRSDLIFVLIGKNL